MVEVGIVVNLDSTFKDSRYCTKKSCSYPELKNIPFLIDARFFFTAFRLGFGEYIGLLKKVARMALGLRLSLVERSSAIQDNIRVIQY